MNTNIKLMMALQRLNMVFIERVEKNINRLGLTVTEFLILAYLNVRDVEKTQKLGEIANITSGTITYAVNKLVRQGYVIQNHDKDDRRISLVSLTDDGRDFYRKAFNEHINFLDMILENFSEDEKQRICEQISDFGNNIKRI